MKKVKREVPEPSLEALDKAPDQDARNRLLLEWLSDDAHRAKLYRLINGSGGSLDFPSRDVALREDSGLETGAKRPEPKTGHKRVRLITDPNQIAKALCNPDKHYSSRVYAELGGGSFMLALDPAEAHSAQWEAYGACFPNRKKHQGLLVDLSRVACDAAAVMGLRAADFDLAAYARLSAVRFCQKLLGYAFTDYPMLEPALQAGYDGLVYQVLGRHFTTNPGALPKAKLEMGRLLARTATLIDAYTFEDEDALKGCTDHSLPKGLVPVLKRLAAYRSDLNGEQRAVIAAGAAVGTVGNVQAAVCIAVKALLADKSRLAMAHELVRTTEWKDDTQRSDAWWELIESSLSMNPPIPFLPRWHEVEGDKKKEQLEKDEQEEDGYEVILALGGGSECRFASQLIWGLPDEAPHWCKGMDLGKPLIAEIVRRVMSLPKLAVRLDPQDAEPFELEKRWGFACERYPFTHQVEDRLAQKSLNVAMRLKTPVHESAARVREVIRSGAPVIEEALRSSRHVHFAWFELIEGDTVLVLHTVYDGPFEAYIDHFALKVGELFDALFECIEIPPPMPVNKYPNEFVAHIRRYDRPPAAGYFFSAYPRLDVASILRGQVVQP